MRRAVVTGGASGIGSAASQRLRAEGWHVTVLDRADPGSNADAWLPFDLDAGSARPEFDGPFDALVNAAGLPPRPGTEAKVLRVNFLALRRLTLDLLPSLSEGASIVNVASKAGAKWRENIEQVRRLAAQPSDARLDEFVASEKIGEVRSYDLSKEAVIAWTKAMTAPLIDRSLRMNCVSPAAVDTPILGDFTRAFGERATRGIAMTRRSGTAAEVGDIIAFLASPSSRWIRGCNIETDGGLAAMLETAAVIGQEFPTGLDGV